MYVCWCPWWPVSFLVIHYRLDLKSILSKSFLVTIWGLPGRWGYSKSSSIFHGILKFSLTKTIQLLGYPHIPRRHPPATSQKIAWERSLLNLRCLAHTCNGWLVEEHGWLTKEYVRVYIDLLQGLYIDVISIVQYRCMISMYKNMCIYIYICAHTYQCVHMYIFG